MSKMASTNSNTCMAASMERLRTDLNIPGIHMHVHQQRIFKQRDRLQNQLESHK